MNRLNVVGLVASSGATNEQVCRPIPSAETRTRLPQRDNRYLKETEMRPSNNHAHPA
jgi:hypothetical protein